MRSDAHNQPSQVRIPWHHRLLQQFWCEPIVQSGALFILIVAVFFRVSTCQFLNHDDPEYVYDNPHVRTGLSVENMAWAFSSLNAEISYWHPVTWLSHQLDCHLFGLRPGAHHLTNVWFHAANALLVLAIFKQLNLGRKEAFVIAGLFAVHPLHVESVAWVAERKDVLFALFWLASLNSYLRFRRTGFGFSYISALFCFALALMSKPTAITLPAVLVLLELMHLLPAPTQGSWNSSGETASFPVRHLVRLAPLVPFALMSVGSGTVTLLAQADIGALPTLSRWPVSERLDNALIAYSLYLKKAVIPFDLCVSYIQTKPHSGLMLLIAGAGLTAVSICAAMVRRTSPWILTGWLWYLLTLVPNIGLIQAGAQSMADRYTYIPLIGVFLICVQLGRAVACRLKQGWVLSALAITAVLFCSLISFRQLAHWTNSVSLFSRAVQLNHDNWMARLGLGMALAQERRFDDALPHLQHALTLPGNSSEAHRGLGICFHGKADFATALHHFEQALKLSPQSAPLHLVLAEILVKNPSKILRDPARAVFLAEEGVKLRRSVGPADCLVLSLAYFEAGRIPEATRMGELATALARSCGDDDLEHTIRQHLANHPQP